MTAYAKHDIKSYWGNAIWEIRSLNQRYLEIIFRFPEQLRIFEPIIREQIRSQITRGKIECSLYFNFKNIKKEEIVINENIVKQFIKAANWIKLQVNEGEINPVDILKLPGVILFQEQNFDIATEDIIAKFSNVLNDFILMREIEGNEIKLLIEQRLKAINSELLNIRNQLPKILNYQREHLINKLSDIKMDLDKNRFEQELIFITQRYDVTEELDRLELHIRETANILQRKEAIGRRLDFMMQELNRESNTLGSKSVSAYITKSVIEIKVLIEQMREQIQNIE